MWSDLIALKISVWSQRAAKSHEWNAVISEANVL